MNKPSTVIYEEFKQDLANLINKSGLPAFVIEPVLQNYLNETRTVAQRQYQADKTAYENSLSEALKNNDKAAE
jgi:hypothetical protein